MIAVILPRLTHATSTAAALAPRLELAGAAARVQPGDIALPATDALLLAWLAIEGPTARERLAALLWPASSEEAARNALRQRLFRLRKACARELVEGSAVLSLAAGVSHDLGHDLGASAGLLGDLHAPEGGELDDWLARQRAQRLAASRSDAEARIDAFEAAGDYAAALPLALAQRDADPHSEAAHRRVMRLHYLRGDRAAALLAFDQCEQVLKHEVGTRPSEQTLALLATIEQAASADGAAGVGAAPGPLPASVLRPPRMIGRDSELAQARQGLGQGHVVVVVGEAGMGKSRLLQALASGQPRLLHASGRPGDPLVPYATLARALRALLDRDATLIDAPLRRALAAVLPELAGAQAPKGPQPPLLQPVLTLLQRATRVVDTLALDDLHFADDATLELLQGLLAAPRDSSAHPLPRWCIGLRPAAAGTRLAALLQALATAGPHTRLALAPLDEAQVAELLRSLALPGVDAAALAPLLHQRTGGNPLFALETIKLAWSAGAIGAVGARADGADGAAELPRPGSLAQLIGQQLARLTPPALQLARVAAVAGVDFSIPLAEQLLARNALELADAWAELEAQQVLRGESFAHDLIHDAVLQALPEPIARHLHGRCAQWLEQQQGEPARIAAHWEAAGQRARALPALRQAADGARRALREGERIAFLLMAADIAEAQGRTGEAFEIVREAVNAHMNTIRQADGLPLLDRLDALARSPAEKATTLSDRGWYAAVLGDQDRGIALGEQAVALASELGDESVLAPARQRLGTTLGMAGRFDAARPHLEASQGWIEAQGSVDERTGFYGNLAVLLDNLGEPAQAQAWHLRALAANDAQHDPAQGATLLANYTLSRLDAGDLPTASAQIAQAALMVSSYETAGSRAGFVALLQAQCARAAGRYADALAACDHAEAILAERNAARVPVARLQRAQVWLDLGQHARAAQLLEGGGDAARAMPPRYSVRWLVLWARLKRRLKQPAAELLAQVQALVPATGWPELALLVRTEQALALDADAALAELAAIAKDARRRALGSAELGAWLHAAALPGGLEAARQALVLAGQGVEAMGADRALRWLNPARALAAAGEIEAAAGWLEEGRQWLRTCAAAHVPAPFVDSFLHQHGANLALATLRLTQP